MAKKVKTITRELVEKYIDGQLDQEGIRMIKRAIERNPEIKAYVEARQETNSMLQNNLVADPEPKDIKGEELDEETTYSLCRMVQGNMDQSDTERIEMFSGKLDDVIEAMRSVQIVGDDIPSAPKKLLDELLGEKDTTETVKASETDNVEFDTSQAFSKSLKIVDKAAAAHIQFSPVTGPAAKVIIRLREKSKDAAVSNAPVILKRIENNKHFFRTHTHRDGTAVLESVPPGNFMLTIEGTGVSFTLEIT